MLAKGKHTHTRTHKNQLGLTLRGPQADGQDRPIGLMKHAPAESGGQKAPLRALEDAATRAPALQGQQLLIEAFSSLQINCALRLDVAGRCAFLTWHTMVLMYLYKGERRTIHSLP